MRKQKKILKMRIKRMRKRISSTKKMISRK
jgi:hypothetical protein